jgi:hypothetical protein
VRVLERGGAAAARLIERLRQTETLLEPFEAAPESLLLYREQQIIAPLLEWSGAGAALKPALDRLRGAPAKTDGSAAREGRPLRPSPVFPPPSRPLTPATVEAPIKAPPVLAANTLQRISRMLSQAEALAAAETRQTAAKGFFPERLNGNPEPWPSPDSISSEDAARQLQAKFTHDVRLLRAWDSVVRQTSGRGEPASATTVEEAHRPAAASAAADPFGILLQPVADRAWRRSAGAASADLPASRILRSDAVPAPVNPLQWTPAVPPGETTNRPFSEPPRSSGLRRLAAYGETIDPERALRAPQPSPAVPVQAFPEAPSRRHDAAAERSDLALEVAELFRREALRHGIVAEEDAP